MKKFTLLFLFCSFLSLSQTQIGSDLNGEASNDAFGESVSVSSDGTILAVGAPSALNANNVSSG